jgi:transcriptional regulator with XRE-family HTH domain
MSNAINAPAENHLPDVASRIRELRKARGLSLDELALRSFVSKSMISQIEGNKTNPTLAMIWKIAQGLETTVQELLEPDSSDDELDEDENTSEILFSHTRKENFNQITAEKPGVHFRVLTPMSQAEDLEIYRISLRPGAVLDSQPHIPGTEEYLTLIKGELEVSAGENSGIMHSGDFIMYNADGMHSMKNIGTETAEVHLVVRFRPELS